MLCTQPCVQLSLSCSHTYTHGTHGTHTSALLTSQKRLKLLLMPLLVRRSTSSSPPSTCVQPHPLLSPLVIYLLHLHPPPTFILSPITSVHPHPSPYPITPPPIILSPSHPFTPHPSLHAHTLAHVHMFHHPPLTFSPQASAVRERHEQVEHARLLTWWHLIGCLGAKRSALFKQVRPSLPIIHSRIQILCSMIFDIA